MSDSSDNSSFLMQQFLVPLGSLIVGLGLLVWIGDLFQAGSAGMREFGGWLGLITAFSAAFAAGYSIHRIWPWTYSAGRIVWILPVFFFLLNLVIDVIRGDSSIEPGCEVLLPPAWRGGSRRHILHLADHILLPVLHRHGCDAQTLHESVTGFCAAMMPLRA